MLKIVRTFAFLPKDCNIFIKRYAGHSKWQNIRHIKGQKDAERGMIFNKLSRQMRIAVQEGGSDDPSLNTKLAQFIDQAKRVNMPVATIQSVLKSCKTDSAQCKAHLVEIKGPGSCFILCEIFTHQLHVFKNTIAPILRKNSSKFSDGGGKHLFEEKGIIVAELADETKNLNADELLETATDHAIQAGAEDVSILEDKTLEFLCGKTNLNKVVNELTPNYKISSASVEYLPIKCQALSEEELQVCSRLYDKLNALPEVVRLFNNIE